MPVSTDPTDPNFGLETDQSSPNFELASEPPKQESVVGNALAGAGDVIKGFAKQFVPDLSLKNLASIAYGPVNAQIQGYNALKGVVDTAEQVREAENTAPFSRERFGAGFNVVGQLGLLALGAKAPKPLSEIAGFKPEAPEAMPQTPEPTISETVPPITETIPTEEITNAVQEQSPSSVLPHPQEGVTETGGKRVGVGPGVQGEATPETRAQAETVAPISEQRAQVLSSFAKKMHDESQGQMVISSAEAEGRTPASIVNDFWNDTFPNLPKSVQLKFQRYVRGETDLTHTEIQSEGGYPEVYNPEAAGQKFENLEGTQRGLISLMKVANDNFGSQVKTAPVSVGGGGLRLEDQPKTGAGTGAAVPPKQPTGVPIKRTIIQSELGAPKPVSDLVDFLDSKFPRIMGTIKSFRVAKATEMPESRFGGHVPAAIKINADGSVEVLVNESKISSPLALAEDVGHELAHVTEYRKQTPQSSETLRAINDVQGGDYEAYKNDPKEIRARQIGTQIRDRYWQHLLEKEKTTSKPDIVRTTPARTTVEPSPVSQPTETTTAQPLTQTPSEPPPVTPETPEAPKTGVSSERFTEQYGEDAPVPNTGRSAGELKALGQTRLDNFQKTGAVQDDPYSVLTNLREGKVPVSKLADDVSLLRAEHQRLKNDAIASEGTPEWEAKSQASLDMAQAIKEVAHGPASDMMRSFQEYDAPKYDNVTDFDQALRERLGRESTSQERVKFKEMADDVTNTRNGAQEAINGAQKKLSKMPKMNFEDAYKSIHDQIAELTKDCVL